MTKKEDKAKEAAAERKQEREDQKAEDAAEDRAAVRESMKADAPNPAPTSTVLARAILVGNHVTGFTVYPLPDVSESDANRLVCHVPEARLIEVHPFEELIDKHGDLPAPANTEPKTKPVEAPDGDAGETDSGAAGAAGDDAAGLEDGKPE